MSPSFLSRLLLLTSLICALGYSVSGAQTGAKARVDFLLRDGIAVEVLNFHGAGAEVKQASWSGQNHLIFTLPASKTWQSASITLQSKTDGRITLIPMSDQETGAQAEAEPRYILFDAFTSSDNSIKNGSFESLDKQGKPTWWHGPDGRNQDASRAAAVISSVSPPDGKNCLRAWHGSKFVQSINLQAGVPVTITFYYRQD